MITADLVVYYLANVIKLAQTDGKMNPKAQLALKEICKRLKVDKEILRKAAGAVSGSYVLMPVGRFSDKVQNLEDMLFVALVDGEFSEAEREQIQGFVDKVHISAEQVEIILTETKIRLDLQMVASECGQCGTSLDPGVKVCPVCKK